MALIIVLVILAALIAGACIYLSGSWLHFGSEEETAIAQGDGWSIQATIDGKFISKDELDRYVIRRIRKVEKKLGLKHAPQADADTMLSDLTEAKMRLGEKAIREKLEKQIRFCDATTKAIIRLSGGKTKFSITQVQVSGVDLDTFLPEFDRLQAVNSEENLRANLGVEPDHYYLGATDDGQLEVIEACGSAPVPTKMFIRYGDETGLSSQWESEMYEEERPGAARLQNGTVQGGVRHQFTRTRDGFKAKLLVEFPSATPGYFLKNHQMHLATEFPNWVKYAATKKQTGGQTLVPDDEKI